MKTKIIYILILSAVLILPAVAQENYEEFTSTDDFADISFDEEIEISDLEEEKFSIYGYLTNYLQTNFYYIDDEFKEPTWGNALLLRLKGDWKPEKNLKFHAEMSYPMQVGNQNPYAFYESLGIASFSQSDFPLHDFNQRFIIDHAWGMVNLGNFDLQFGKFPIAWGTGYVFNPTARVTTPLFLDMISEETPGMLGMLPSYAISDRFSLQGYTAFQDKTQKLTAFKEDGKWENMPYGIKFKTILGSYDLSLSLIKEVLYKETADAEITDENSVENNYHRTHYLGFDFVGAIWDFGVYGEFTSRLPSNSDGTDFFDKLEGVIGFDYTIPNIEVDMKLEYYYQGVGEKNKENYDILKILSGERLVQAKHYVFPYIERTFLDYLKIFTAALININDGSFVILPELTYEPYDNFQMTFGSLIFYGKASAEFNGRYKIFDTNEVDLTENFSTYAKFKLSF